MSNNADFESLARELRALRESGNTDEESRSRETMLVMRLVRGFSSQRWQEFCRLFPLSQWCALPVADVLPSARLADLGPDVQAHHLPEIPTSALAMALNAELFTSQLSRELLRLSRSGGDLSLLCTSVLPSAAGDGQEKLEQALAASLRLCLEACDSMGSLRRGRYAAILPGMGQLEVRHLAEKLQKTFDISAIEPKSARGATPPRCAVGVVCVDRYAVRDAAQLLDKAHAALDAAQAQPEGHIHQDGPGPLDDRATLVHSDEKRFLFFGDKA